MTCQRFHGRSGGLDGQFCPWAERPINRYREAEADGVLIYWSPTWHRSVAAVRATSCPSSISAVPIRHARFRFRNAPMVQSRAGELLIQVTRRTAYDALKLDSMSSA